jgi:hypothetical protein
VVVTVGPPSKRVVVQMNVLDVKFVGVTELLLCAGFKLEFDFFDPTTAPTIAARRAKKLMSIIIIPLFVR